MKPKGVLAMMGGLADLVFSVEQRERVGELIELVQDAPVESWGSTPDELLAEIEVVIGHWGCPSLTAEVLERLPNLRLFAYAAGSVKERDTVTPAVFERGITVTTAAAANAIPVAEYTLGVILLANKGTFIARDRLRSADGPDPRQPSKIGNVDKRVGIIGASRTGRCLIELLRPFDLEAVVHDPYLSDADADRLGVATVTLDELLATSDIVSIHAPLTQETDGLIGTHALAAMKDGAVLVNTARGKLVDTDALIDELRTGRISAVLDVTWPEPLDPESPLLQLPNAFVTPHVAGSMGNELFRLTDSALDEIERYATGQPALHPIRAGEFDRLA